MPTFFAELDHLTGVRVGAMVTFLVISLRDQYGIDRTKWVDQGTHYSSLEEIAADIAKILKVPKLASDNYLGRLTTTILAG